eukprot:1571993-Rhodomonas_salina.2
MMVCAGSASAMRSARTRPRSTSTTRTCSGPAACTARTAAMPRRAPAPRTVGSRPSTELLVSRSRRLVSLPGEQLCCLAVLSAR